MYRPTLFERAVNLIIRGILVLLCRVERSEVKNLPMDGPYLLSVNHINFLDIPILYLYLLPRKVTGLVKKETWNVPLHGFLARLWHAIPIRRGIVDTEGMNLCVEYLSEGGILFVAPEGTRSCDGRLNRGKAGIVALTVRSGVPVYPLAHFGGESLRHNLKRLRRTKITMRVGRPFRIDPGETSVTPSMRREIADLVMYRIAELLPESYRGVYAGKPPEDENGYLKDLGKASRETAG